MSTIVTRSGKGSPLSHVEVDANFTNLDTDKVEKTAAAITGGTINGTTIGATTPSTVNATTLSGQTGVLRGTGNNLLLRSEDFANASWSVANSTIASNTSTAPNGTLTADTLTENTATTTHIIQQFTASSYTSGVSYTLSFYAKPSGRSWVWVFFPSAAFSTSGGAYFNISTGAVGALIAGATASIVSAGDGWYRCSVTRTATVTSAGNTGIGLASADNTNSYTGDGVSGAILWGAQLELGSTANTYIPTTTTAVYGTPTLSFSGVSTLGLESNGALFLQPAGTGAIQAQATTSTTAGGNVRGANAVDWQTVRSSAGQVASGSASVVSGGQGNQNTGSWGVTVGGYFNTNTSYIGTLLGGQSNTVGSQLSVSTGGQGNTANGFYNFIGGGFTNSGTSASAVTTQSGTMNATTAVTLSGSNANIKVGQLIQGTSIASYTYVAAISGTSLTLSQAASGSSTSTLSFFTPHGVVVGGGNNQATGSYSFIGGGGDAGTAANRNVASGLYGTIVGGRGNTASGIGSFVGGGGVFLDTVTNTYPNTASGAGSVVVGGLSNTSSANYSCVLGGFGNTANSIGSTAFGTQTTTRSIIGSFAYGVDGTVGFTQGLSQAALLILGRQTTDATATALTSNSSAAGTTNQVILPNNSAYFFRGEVVSGVTGGGNTKGWTIEGVIKRGANAASTALVGTPTVVSTYADVGAATWAIAVTADTTNGGIAVTFTGQAATTIRTVCQIRTTEMTY